MKFFFGSATKTTLLVAGIGTALATNVEIPVSGNPASVDLLCEDTSEHGPVQCQEWALRGECEQNKEYMEQECRKSCGFCNGGDGYQPRMCMDLAEEGETQCREWAWHGECDKNPDFMGNKCRKSCGLCTPPDEEPKCEDSFDDCHQWAQEGRCVGNWQAKKSEYIINSAFVVDFCPKACGVCDIRLDELDFKLGMGFFQTAPDVDNPYIRSRLKGKIADIRRYMLTLPPDLREVCKFGHINCARFTLAEEECEVKADHYIFKYLCASACKTCEKFVDPDERAIVQAHYKEALDEANLYLEHQRRKQAQSAVEEEWE